MQSFRKIRGTILKRGVADLPADRQGGRMRRTKTVELRVLKRGVAEWSNAAVLKTVEPRGSGGSNPSSSANQLPSALHWVFYFRTY